MSLKDQILNKIKSINDLKLLRELDAWISQAEEEMPEQANEPAGRYLTEGSVKNRGKKGTPDQKLKFAIDCLEKIAGKGGVEGIEDPVEWQKKERRDRTLTIS